MDISNDNYSEWESDCCGFKVKQSSITVSGSMEPSYYRGDILFLTNFEDDVKIGDIVVYQLPGDEIPIVHRVVTYQEM